MSPMRDEQTTSEDRATQLFICESLSFAIIKERYMLNDNYKPISRKHSTLPAYSPATVISSPSRTTSSSSKTTQPVSTGFRWPWWCQTLDSLFLAYMENSLCGKHAKAAIFAHFGQLSHISGQKINVCHLSNMTSGIVSFSDSLFLAVKLLGPREHWLCCLSLQEDNAK